MSPYEYITTYTIVDPETDMNLSGEHFTTREAVAAWLTHRISDLAQCVVSGTISGWQVKEDRTDVQYILIDHRGLPYLSFGARILTDPQSDVLVVAVPVEHVMYHIGRLASGLARRAGPFMTFKEACLHAERGL